MPPRGRRDHFVAVWTASPLTFPEREQCFSSPEGVCHLAPEALFEVDLPARVVGIHAVVNLDMACNVETMRGEEVDGSGGTLRRMVKKLMRLTGVVTNGVSILQTINGIELSQLEVYMCGLAVGRRLFHARQHALLPLRGEPHDAMGCDHRFVLPRR